MKIELFNAIYGCYFSTVYHILKEAGRRELTDSEFHELIRKNSDIYGFSLTTSGYVSEAIEIGEDKEIIDNKDAWPFFDLEQKKEGRGERSSRELNVHKNRLQNISQFPLSIIEKMWFKSIYSDPRIRLFIRNKAELPDLGDVEPLFNWDDFVLFDQYADGDPFEDEHYIEMFRRVLEGVRNQSRLEIKFRKNDKHICFNADGSYEIEPGKGTGTLYIDSEYIEYSERDNKFRLIGNNPRFGRNMVNIALIDSCEEVERIDLPNAEYKDGYSKNTFRREAVFELIDDKNTLERFLLHFSHNEKIAEHLEEEGRYRITILYDETDETDLVIRTLSFGPYVKVVSPDSFVNLIYDRLRQQMELLKNRKDQETRSEKF